MNKTEKELAFLRELSIENDWTQRFTDTLDKNFDFAKEAEILYINAGTGNHTIALREKLDDKAIISGVCENDELLLIAQAKADAVKADVHFSCGFPDDRADIVLADATFVEPGELKEFIENSVDRAKDKVAFFLPTAGSFGEVFSFLWESLLKADLLEHGPSVEELISEIPTVSKVEDIAKDAGLTKLQTITTSEIFEYKNAGEFLESTLVADFLLPRWLGSLDEGEAARLRKELASEIDEEDGSMTFRFSVKATLIAGEKG